MHPFSNSPRDHCCFPNKEDTRNVFLKPFILEIMLSKKLLLNYAATTIFAYFYRRDRNEASKNRHDKKQQRTWIYRFIHCPHPSPIQNILISIMEGANNASKRFHSDTTPTSSMLCCLCVTFFP